MIPLRVYDSEHAHAARLCTCALRSGTFKEHRPNGIYKEDYIRTLYQYYHEPL